MAELGRRPHGAPGWRYALAVALVEPMRGVLWLMLTAGELLTCGVLRRMEHDADDVEAHVCGGADFVRTAKLLVFLGIAHGGPGRTWRAPSRTAGWPTTCPG